MYQVRHEILGKIDGNFRLSQTDLFLFSQNLKRHIQERAIAKIFIPHCNLGTCVARLGDGNEKEITPWLIRTEPGFDGAMVTEPNVAIGILNADCPIITLFDKKNGQLILLHGGLKCLRPSELSKPSIVDSAFRNFKLHSPNLEAFIGFGAGPCCYGINHIAHRGRKFHEFLDTAKNGPRRGQDSLNLSELAKAQLLKHGLRENSIEISNECTACTGREDGNPKYHSNIYDGETGGRNLAFAWFETV